MQSRIARVFMSGLGIATLATLSLVTTKNINQVNGDSLSAKANEPAGAVRLACGGAYEPKCSNDAAVAGVRG